ncbi:MAG: hypothetical protein AAF618_07335 [Pseudomonadota bacterium]
MRLYVPPRPTFMRRLRGEDPAEAAYPALRFARQAVADDVRHFLQRAALPAALWRGVACTLADCDLPLRDLPVLDPRLATRTLNWIDRKGPDGEIIRVYVAQPPGNFRLLEVVTSWTGPAPSLLDHASDWLAEMGASSQADSAWRLGLEQGEALDVAWHNGNDGGARFSVKRFALGVN